MQPQHRRDTPRFTVDGQPLRHSTVDSTLRSHLLVYLAPSEAENYSAHSARIGLACALRAPNRPAPLI
ncbi:MAG: hypothetical protein AAFU79_37080 [Myxococcota bacterium]